MKRIFYILALLVLVVFAAGCTSDQWQSNQTFSGSGVTFVYPGTWTNESTNQYGDLTGNSTYLASVGSTDYGLAIGTVTIPAGVQINNAELQQLKAVFKNSTSNATYVSDKDITVDGVSGIQVDFKDAKFSSGDAYLSIVAWPKNNQIHLLVYGSKNNDTQTLDKILGTVQTS